MTERGQATGRTVVIISTDERLMRMLRWTLGEAGQVPRAFPDADRVLEAQCLAAEVILYDGPMGAAKRDGALRLRQRFPGARMIGLHVHGDGAEAHIEADAHLHKPFGADDLLETIELVLQRNPGTPSEHPPSS